MFERRTGLGRGRIVPALEARCGQECPRSGGSVEMRSATRQIAERLCEQPLTFVAMCRSKPPCFKASARSEGREHRPRDQCVEGFADKSARGRGPAVQTP